MRYNTTQRTATCIVLPDIHGRDFWKSVLSDDFEWQSNTYIFLGDFFDPYIYEGISEERTIANFMELQDAVKAIRRKHKKVITLVGNHDAHYINAIFDMLVGGVRKSEVYASYIRSLLNEDKTFIHSIAYEMNVLGKKVLFSHAGVTSVWYDMHKMLIGGLNAENLNRLSYSDKGWMALSNMSEYRGGLNDYGSCIYADIHEHYVEGKIGGQILPIPNYDYQVFGHTQQKKYPVINDKFAMLDCRHAFAMTEDLKFHQID